MKVMKSIQRPDVIHCHICGEEKPVDQFYFFAKQGRYMRPCLECRKARRKSDYDPKAQKAINKDLRERNGAKYNEARRTKYASDQDYREKKKLASQRQREKPGAKERAKKLSKEWRRKNPERLAEMLRSYAERNYSKVRGIQNAAQRKRKTAKMQAIPPWYDHALALDVYSSAVKRTDDTGIPHEVDHIVPLQGENVCGLHWHENLQVIEMAANRRKSNRFE